MLNTQKNVCVARQTFAPNYECGKSAIWWEREATLFERGNYNPKPHFDATRWGTTTLSTAELIQRKHTEIQCPEAKERRERDKREKDKREREKEKRERKR